MKIILLAFMLVSGLMANSLELKEGFVQAHTEMMMDSTINPLNSRLHAEVSMDNNDFTTLTGKFWVDMDLFVSDNTDRDEHMDEATNVKKYPLATYTIKNIIKKTEDTYALVGIMDFHGVKKELTFQTQILKSDSKLNFSAEVDILGSDFGLDMPCMVFMCVDDKINLLVEAKFK